MKLEENMYVRTNDGYINKIKSVSQYNVLVDGRDLFGEELNIPNNEITKASHNIIDLIEAGDYVNGLRVDEIGEYHSIKTDKVETYAKVNCSALLNCFYEEDIKSIVTKEMYSNVEYKVETN